MLAKLNPNWIIIFMALLVNYCSATSFYGVCVGIDDYPGTVYDLNYCTEDAEDLKDALVNEQDWTSGNISLLLDSDASESDIDDALDDLSANFGKTIWFSVSGHGNSSGVIPANSISANFTPSESESAVDPPTGYDEYAFFIDACYSGVYPRDLDNGVITSACDSDELSYEPSALQHGIYSFYLIDGLTNNAADPGDIVSAEDLFNYASTRTTAYESDQHPQMSDNYSGDLNLYAPSTSGTLIDNENWTGTHTLSGNITVPTGVTLTISYAATMNLSSYEITVNSGGSMEIEPGVTLEFGASKALKVYGTLDAEGTSGNMITFDKSGASDWGGIRFYDSSDDSECSLSYCTIDNGLNYGIYCYESNPTIENCTIQNCTSGIYLYYPDASTDNIKNNVLSDITYYGIRQLGGDSHTSGNDISECLNGINISSGDMIIEADTIHHNTDDGIKLTGSDAILIKNLIYNNDGNGIYCYNYSDPELRDPNFTNNVIAYNKHNGVKIDNTSLPDLSGHSSENWNSLYDNWWNYDEVYSEQSSTVYARNNWWGETPPDTTRFYGNISLSNYQSSDPNPDPHDLDKLLANSFESLPSDQAISQSLPSNPEAHKIFYEGYQLQADDKYDEALANFKTVIANYPESFEAMMALSRVRKCLKQADRLNELESYLTSIYEPIKNHLLGGKVLEMQTSLLVKNKSNNEALANCETIIKDFPDSDIEKNALLEKWMIYLIDLNDLGAAKKVMDEYGSKYGDDEDYVLMMLEMGEITSEQADALKNSLYKSHEPNKKEAAVPVAFQVSQNYPNPFNPETKIQIGLPKDSDVKLQIFNIRGQVVATPFEGNLPAGSHTVNFNASTLPSGLYFYKIIAGEFSDVKRMVLLK